MKTKTNLPLKSLLFAILLLLHQCKYLQRPRLEISEFLLFFPCQWFVVLVQIIDSVLLSYPVYGKKGAEDVVLKCPLLQNSHYRNDTSGFITVKLALCCIKCSPKWTRSLAFEPNSPSLCSTWVEDINAYLCGLGLATLLGNRIFYVLR